LALSNVQGAPARPRAAAPALTFAAARGGGHVQPPHALAGPAAAPAALPAAPAAEAPADAEPAAPKQRKKARWTDERKEAAKVDKPAVVTALAAAAPAATPAAATAGEPVAAKEKKKKAPALRKLEPEERVSGPSNAEEAERMRAALGFAAPVQQPAAPAAGGAFAFGFAGNAPAAEAEASSDEEGEEEEEEEEVAVAAAADSSSEEESSSSDEEEAAPAADTARAPPSADALAALESEYVPRRVYAGGMPFGYTETQVREFWEYCGAIESLDLLTFPDTGRFRGIAFITYATEDAYAAALECDGQDCDGGTLKVQKCRWSAKDRRAAAAAAHAFAPPPAQPAAAFAPPAAYAAAAPAAAAPAAAAPAAAAPAAPARPQHAAAAPKTAGYDVAYVGNIAYEADEAAVRALFEPYGVTKVRIHTDKDTGRPKGFAHIHFK
jgi:nucleolin